MMFFRSEAAGERDVSLVMTAGGEAGIRLSGIRISEKCEQRGNVWRNILPQKYPWRVIDVNIKICIIKMKYLLYDNQCIRP